MQAKEKELPSNIEAEEGVLGSILIDPEQIVQVEPLLKAEDFFRIAHRHLYTAIVTLYARDVQPDAITIRDWLKQHNFLDAVGGSGYIVSLINRPPDCYDAEHYARIVARTAHNRRLIAVAGKIAALAQMEDPDAQQRAEALLAELEDGQQNRYELVGIDRLLPAYMRTVELAYELKGALRGITTGFVDLDRLLQGLQKTDLIILAARPGIGKTALALSILAATSKAGNSVAMYSLEMGAQQLIARLMAMQSKVDLHSLNAGWLDEEQWARLADAENELGSRSIYINDASGSPVASMRNSLRQLLRRGPIDLVIVDYLQLMESDLSGNANREAEIAKISRELKGLAKEFNVPVLALAQINRAVEARSSKIPQLSDLRNSGAIEQDADVVMFIHRDDMYNEMSERRGQADLIVAKHRNGPLGTVVLKYWAQWTRFDNLDDSYSDDSQPEPDYEAM